MAVTMLATNSRSSSVPNMLSGTLPATCMYCGVNGAPMQVEWLSCRRHVMRRVARWVADLAEHWRP